MGGASLQRRGHLFRRPRGFQPRVAHTADSGRPSNDAQSSRSGRDPEQLSWDGLAPLFHTLEAVARVREGRSVHVPCA